MSSVPRIRSNKKRLLRLRARSRFAPPYWRLVDDGHLARTWAQQQQWALVLESRNIPYERVTKGRHCYFYVPPVVEGVARAELRDFSREGRRAPPPPPPPVHGTGNWAVFFFIPLLLWHGLRAGWWGVPEGWALSPELWSAHGALDVVRMKVYHEWYRAVTALTLHADSQHILGNIAFGSIFCILLCRVVGLGLGLLLTLGGGALGNLCNALSRQGSLISLGFSTALFAAVGALSGALAVQTHQKRGKALAPLAAGCAILAMLGTEGERTDYAAHIWGLLCGAVLGIFAQILLNRKPFPVWGQWCCGVGALLLVILCWKLAGV